MATLGDAYSFTATKAAVRSVMPVIRDKTPAKSPGPRRMSGFQHYLLQEHHSLGAKYPFLTQSQIKSKIAKNWSKLNDTDKDEYIPIKISKKTPVKKQTLADRVAAARSPGWQLKSHKKTENFTPPRRTVKAKSAILTSLHPVALKSPRAPRKSFDYDYFDDEIESGVSKLGSETGTPVSQSDDSVNFDLSQTDKRYGGSNRRASRLCYKPPDIVQDEPTDVQAGILKERQQEENSSNKKRRGRVSFGGAKQTIIKRQRYLTSPSSDPSFSPPVNDRPSDWIKEHKKKVKSSKKWVGLSEDNTKLTTYERKEDIPKKGNGSIDVDDFYGMEGGFNDDGDSDEDGGGCQLLCREEEFIEGDERNTEGTTDDGGGTIQGQASPSTTKADVLPNEEHAKDLDGTHGTVLSDRSPTPTPESTPAKKKKGRPPKKRNSTSEPNTPELNDKSVTDKENKGSEETVTRRPTRSSPRNQRPDSGTPRKDTVDLVKEHGISTVIFFKETGKTPTPKKLTVKISRCVTPVSPESLISEPGVFKTPSLPVVPLSRYNTRARSVTPNRDSTLLARTGNPPAVNGPTSDDCTPQMQEGLLKATIKQAVKLQKKRKRSDASVSDTLPELEDDDALNDGEKKPKKARKCLGDNKKEVDANKPVEMMSPYEKRKFLNKIKVPPVSPGQTEDNINSGKVPKEKKTIDTSDNVRDAGNADGVKSKQKLFLGGRHKKQVTLERYMTKSKASADTGVVSKSPSKSGPCSIENEVTVVRTKLPKNKKPKKDIIVPIKKSTCTLSVPSTSSDETSEYHFTNPITAATPELSSQPKMNNETCVPEIHVKSQIQSLEICSTQSKVESNPNDAESVTTSDENDVAHSKAKAMLKDALPRTRGKPRDPVEHMDQDATGDELLTATDGQPQHGERNLEVKSTKPKVKTSVKETSTDLKVASIAAPLKPTIRNVRTSLQRSLLLVDDTDGTESSESLCNSQGAAVVDETIMLMRQLVMPQPSWMNDDISLMSGISELSEIPSLTDDLQTADKLPDEIDLYDHPDPDDLQTADKLPDEIDLYDHPDPEPSPDSIWSLASPTPSSNTGQKEEQPDETQPEQTQTRKSRRVSVRDGNNNNMDVKKSTSIPTVTDSDDKSPTSSVCLGTPDLPDVIPPRHTPGCKSYSKSRSKQDFNLLDLFDQISPQGAEKKTPGPSRRLVTSCQKLTENITNLFEEDSFFA